MELKLFKDKIIPSSELNRHSGQILDEAGSRPITITRPRGDLVLLPRAQAAVMVEATQILPLVAKALAHATARLADRRYDLDWISRLSDQDLVTLVSELADVFAAGREDAGPMAEAVLYEWGESRRWLDDPEAYTLLAESQMSGSKQPSQ